MIWFKRNEGETDGEQFVNGFTRGGEGSDRDRNPNGRQTKIQGSDWEALQRSAKRRRNDRNGYGD